MNIVLTKYTICSMTSFYAYTYNYKSALRALCYKAAFNSNYYNH